MKILRLVKYLILLVLAAGIVVLSLANRGPMTLQLLPDDLAEFAGYNQTVELPVFVVILIGVATGLLIGFSEGFVAYWQYLFGGALLAILGLRAYVGTEDGRLRWDAFKLRIPAVGGIMRRALLARFARTFSMAVRSGVPLLQAMDLVAEATDNAYIARGIRQLRTGIERGEGLHQVAERSGLFTPLVLQMLAVGEETGQVADMMDQVAEFYEREVEEDLKKLSSYIEPFVIGFIGILVLILALGIFLPMWQMGSAAL